MKHSEGFTLIEVMIGMLVFSIGILGVVSMQTTSIAANAKAQHTSVGSALASSLLATIRPLDYNAQLLPLDQYDPSQEVRGEGDRDMPEQEAEDESLLYAIRFEVTALDGGRDPLDGEVALVSVHVGWEDYGTSHETTFHYFRQDELR